VVVGQNAGGISYGGDLTFTTLPNPPSAPTNLAVATISSSQIQLVWVDTSSDEEGFSIERCGTAGIWGEIDRVSAGATTYTNASLPSLGKYSYRVRAYIDPVYSNYSNEGTDTTWWIPTSPVLTTYGVAVVAFGDYLYVGDGRYGNSQDRIYKVNLLTGQQEMTWSCTGVQGLAVDQAGNIYASSNYSSGTSGPSVFRKFDGNGVLLGGPWTITSQAGAWGIAVSNDGSIVWIAHSNTNSGVRGLYRMTWNGSTWTTPSRLVTDLSYFGVAFDPTNQSVIFTTASGTNRNRLTKRNATTGAAMTWTYGIIPGTNSFSNPRGVDVDQYGNVYVADSGYRRVIKITATGVCSFVGKTPPPPSNNYALSQYFNTAVGLTSANDGSLLVLEDSYWGSSSYPRNDRVQRLWP
jgi:hypothetical protein